MEMPGLGPVQAVGREEPYWGGALKTAIQSGAVSAKALDQAVGRILTQMQRFGFLDGSRVSGATLIDVEADAKVARLIATQGAVLLKNDGILPLTAAAGSDLALIGPTAGQIAVGPGAGRSEGIAGRLISPREALQRTLGKELVYAVGGDLTGVAIPPQALSSATGVAGLTRSAADGTPATIDASVDFVGAHALPAGRAVHWAGVLRVPETGDYLLATQSWGGSAALSIAGEQKATSARLAFGNGVPRRLSSLLPTTDGLDNGEVSLRLVAGQAYEIDLAAQAEPYSTMQLRLSWVTPEMVRRNRAAAVAAAKAARTVIVFAWARGGEGFDSAQSLSLPGGQDDLISAVAAANPNTLVVLNTGNPVAMPWKDQVRAILEMWFPGQEGGWATADLLMGKAEPAGRLPITFPERGIDTPALAPGHPERSVGVDGSIRYSEGIFVGYRHYDENRITPLYPFGYGLSYTAFEYSSLRVRPQKDGADVSFRVRNVGSRAGVEIPQVYAGRPETAPVPMAPQVLAGFARVALNPGEATTLRIHIGARQMSYWSATRHAWVIPPGRRPLFVGASSRDIRLTGSLDLRNH
jgi:beta-glucosidase